MTERVIRLESNESNPMPLGSVRYVRWTEDKDKKDPAKPLYWSTTKFHEHAMRFPDTPTAREMVDALLERSKSFAAEWEWKIDVAVAEE